MHDPLNKNPCPYTELNVGSDEASQKELQRKFQAARKAGSKDAKEAWDLLRDASQRVMHDALHHPVEKVVLPGKRNDSLLPMSATLPSPDAGSLPDARSCLDLELPLAVSEPQEMPRISLPNLDCLPPSIVVSGWPIE